MAAATTLGGPRTAHDPWYTSSPYEPVKEPITRLEDIDLLDATLYSQGDPHAVWKLMREEAPILWHERGNEGTEGKGFWALTRYETIREVHRNVEVFSNVKGPFFDLAADRLPHGLADMDAPDHRTYRSLVARYLAPRAMRTWEGTITEIVTGLIDDIIEAGSCDFAQEALKLPMLALSALIGISPAETRDLKRMLDSVDSNQSDIMRVYNELVIDFFKGCVQERRQHSESDSILGVVASAEIDGSPLGLDEAASLLHQLFTAGVDSTGISASLMLLSLFHHPDQRETWARDPTITESAVEELLRWSALVHCNKRWVLADTELEGQLVRQGDYVTTWHPSASRDERAFENPYTLELRRSANLPIPTFGGGPHHCPGAYFARLELQVLLREVLLRMQDLEQAGPAVRVGEHFTLTVAPMTSLPIKFRAEERATTTS